MFSSLKRETRVLNWTLEVIWALQSQHLLIASAWHNWSIIYNVLITPTMKTKKWKRSGTEGLWEEHRRGAGEWETERCREQRHEGVSVCEERERESLPLFFAVLRHTVQPKVGAALSAFDKWVPAERPVGVQTKSGRTLGALFVIPPPSPLFSF